MYNFIHYSVRAILKQEMVSQRRERLNRQYYKNKKDYHIVDEEKMTASALGPEKVNNSDKK